MCVKTQTCVFFFFSLLAEARSAQKTKEVGAGVVVGGQGAVAQRGGSRLRRHAAEQGGQRCHAHADGEEDGRQDGDSAQRVGGHHDHRGVHRSGQLHILGRNIVD